MGVKPSKPIADFRKATARNQIGPRIRGIRLSAKPPVSQDDLVGTALSPRSS